MWDMIQILLQTLWPEPILKYLLQIPAGQANSTTVHPQLSPIVCGFQHVSVKNSGIQLEFSVQDRAFCGQHYPLVQEWLQFVAFLIQDEIVMGKKIRMP